jgi:hypothetical protein
MTRSIRKHVPPSDRPEVKRARNQRNYQERKLRAMGWSADSEADRERRERWPSALGESISSPKSESEVNDDVDYNAELAETPSDLSCIGLVTTPSEVVEEGLGVAGDAWRGGELLVAEADGGGP